MAAFTRLHVGFRLKTRTLESVLSTLFPGVLIPDEQYDR